MELEHTGQTDGNDTLTHLSRLHFTPEWKSKETIILSESLLFNGFPSLCVCFSQGKLIFFRVCLLTRYA